MHAILPLMMLLFLSSTAVCAEETLTSPLDLSAALTMAARQHPSLAEAEAAVASSQAQRQQAIAERGPKLAAQYTYSRLADQPYQLVGGTQRFVGDENAHHWDISLTQPLFTGYALSSQQAIAEQAVAMTQERQQQARLQLALEVRLAWYATLLARRRLQVSGEQQQALAAHAANTAAFFQQGLVARHDQLKADAALAQARQDNLQAGADLQVALAQLSLLLGIRLTDAGQLVEESDAATFSDAAALQNEALAKSPLLQELRLALTQTDQQIRLAGSSQWPSLSAVARYERNGSELGAADNHYSNEDNASLLLTARWELFDNGRREAAVARQLAEKQRWQAKIRSIEDQIRLEVQRALADWQVAAGSIAVAEKGCDQASENWRITEMQFQHQLATTAEVLDARSLLSQAELNLHRARYGTGIAQARMWKVLGRQ